MICEHSLLVIGHRLLVESLDVEILLRPQNIEHEIAVSLTSFAYGELQYWDEERYEQHLDIESEQPIGDGEHHPVEHKLE